jgi:hypothetical protein
MIFRKPMVLLLLFQGHKDRGTIYNKVKGLHVNLRGYNKFQNFSSTGKHVDWVHGTVDQRRSQIHGGLSGGADICAAVHHRCAAHRTLRGSEACR